MADWPLTVYFGLDRLCWRFGRLALTAYFGGLDRLLWLLGGWPRGGDHAVFDYLLLDHVVSEVRFEAEDLLSDEPVCVRVCVRVRVRVCACVCVRACARACVCVCMRARARVCVCECVSVPACMRMRADVIQCVCGCAHV